VYIGIVTDLPEGTPIGTDINLDARLVGYFFKLQGYISTQQQLDAERMRKKPMPLKAPLILGRLVWTPTASVAAEGLPTWAFATIGGVAVVLLVGWILLTMRKFRRPAAPVAIGGPGPDPKGPSVDNWLDEAQSGRLTLEPVPETTAHVDGAALRGGFGGRLAGNIFWENGESNNGHGPDNGRGGADPGVHDNGNPSGE
jgi:hypothetical protein